MTKSRGECQEVKQANRVRHPEERRSSTTPAGKQKHALWDAEIARETKQTPTVEYPKTQHASKLPNRRTKSHTGLI